MPFAFSPFFCQTKIHFPPSPHQNWLAWHFSARWYACGACSPSFIFWVSAPLGPGSIVITWALLGSGPSETRHAARRRKRSNRIKRGNIFASKKPLLLPPPWERKLMLRDEEKKNNNKNGAKRRASICSFGNFPFRVSIVCWAAMCLQSEWIRNRARLHKRRWDLYCAGVMLGGTFISSVVAGDGLE